MISIKSPDATLNISQSISDISANYNNLGSFEFVENVQYNITVSQDVSTVEWMVDSVSVRGFIQEFLLVMGNNSSCEAQLLEGVGVCSTRKCFKFRPSEFASGPKRLIDEILLHVEIHLV